MRLATIRTPDGPRAAVLRSDSEAVILADYGDVGALLRAGADATGTPGGVGEAMKKFLAPGDVVEVHIDGIGAIRTTFTASPASV